MDNCQLCYGSRGADSAGESILPDFLPLHRTFQLRALERNTSYYLVFTCTDIYGEGWASDWIYFTTGIHSSTEKALVTVNGYVTKQLWDNSFDVTNVYFNIVYDKLKTAL